MSTSEKTPLSNRPWWSFAHVWMVIAGPAVVVVAGFFTYYLAVRAPDPVLPTSPAVSADPAGRDISQAPAVQARNHAATGQMPAPQASRP